MRMYENAWDCTGGVDAEDADNAVDVDGAGLAGAGLAGAGARGAGSTGACSGRGCLAGGES